MSLWAGKNFSEGGSTGSPALPRCGARHRQAELESLQRTESRDKEAGAKAAKKEDGKGGGSRKEGAGSPGDDKGGGAKGGKTVKQPSIKAL